MVEVYYAAFSAALFAPEEVSRRDLEREIAGRFERALLLGEAERREAANRVTFANALERLVQLRVLERARPGEGRGSPREERYARGPAFDQLRGSCERLAADLAPR